MRSLMDEDGWIDLEHLTKFPRLHRFGANVSTAAASLLGSRTVEVSWDGTRARNASAILREAFPYEPLAEAALRSTSQKDYGSVAVDCRMGTETATGRLQREGCSEVEGAMRDFGFLEPSSCSMTLGDGVTEGADANPDIMTCEAQKPCDSPIHARMVLKHVLFGSSSVKLEPDFKWSRRVKSIASRISAKQHTSLAASVAHCNTRILQPAGLAPRRATRF